MPKLINAYSTDTSLADVFKDFAGTFGQNTAQTELARQKAYGLNRDNRAYRVLQDAERAGGYDPENAEVRAAIVGLDKPVEFFQAQRGLAATRYGAADPRTTNTYVGAGGAYSGTVQGTRESEANKRAIENLRTQRLFDAERYKADMTPQQVLTPEGPVIVSRRAAIESRATPILSHGEAQGLVVQRNLPAMTPEQQARVGGYAPKLPGNVWVYKKPDGTFGNTVDAKTDAQTGQPITGPAMKLEGPNTEGLTDNQAINRDLIQSETATKQAVQGIDNLVGQLSKPDAAKSVGFIGAMASTLNGLRAQAEALGGLTKEQAMSSPENAAAIVGATNNVINSNPALVARLQQLGVSKDVLHSQITDLAYLIAKTQAGSGDRISNADAEKAAQTIGATLMDPTAGIAVLQDLKNRTIENYRIKEEVVRSRYPNLRPNAPQQAPGTAAPAPNVEKWGRDASGNLVRMQ